MIVGHHCSKKTAEKRNKGKAGELWDAEDFETLKLSERYDINVNVLSEEEELVRVFHE